MKAPVLSCFLSLIDMCLQLMCLVADSRFLACTSRQGQPGRSSRNLATTKRTLVHVLPFVVQVAAHVKSPNFLPAQNLEGLSQGEVCQDYMQPCIAHPDCTNMHVCTPFLRSFPALTNATSLMSIYWLFGQHEWLAIESSG